MASLSLDQLQVATFATSDAADSYAPADDSEGTFCRGCDTWAFSCQGTCHYPCNQTA